MNIRRVAFSAVLCACGGLFQATAANKVDARQRYERLACVVPLVGKGTITDPRRPQYAPIPGGIDAASRKGVLGYQSQESDDHKFALVEFVATDRAAFAEILADSKVKSFLKGKDKKDDIEAEFKKYKKDFDFTKFGVRLP